MARAALRTGTDTATRSPRTRRARSTPPPPEYPSAGSLLPPGPVEQELLAVREYKRGWKITDEQRALVLKQLCHELRVFLRIKRGWWDRPGDWVTSEDLLRWARGEGWRVAEVDAALEHLALCGELERRDGESSGWLRVAEWRAVSR